MRAPAMAAGMKAARIARRRRASARSISISTSTCANCDNKSDGFRERAQPIRTTGDKSLLANEVGEHRSPDGAQRNPGLTRRRPRITRSLSSGAHSRDPLAPSGLQPLYRVVICPSGALSTGVSSLISDFPKNISVPTYPKSILELLPSHPTRGAYRDRHGRGEGCGGRGSVLRATGLQGGLAKGL